MCLVISLLCFAIAYVSFEDGNTNVGIINLIIGLFFIGLMIRNIIKTKKERS